MASLTASLHWPPVSDRKVPRPSRGIIAPLFSLTSGASGTTEDILGVGRSGGEGEGDDLKRWEGEQGGGGDGGVTQNFWGGGERLHNNRLLSLM